MIRYATKEDVPRIHQLIKDLAEYEKAPLEAKATLEQIEESLFSQHPVAYCHVAEDNGLVVGISIWFLNYSTWVGKIRRLWRGHSRRVRRRGRARRSRGTGRNWRNRG